MLIEFEISDLDPGSGRGGEVVGGRARARARGPTRLGTISTLEPRLLKQTTHLALIHDISNSTSNSNNDNSNNNDNNIIRIIVIRVIVIIIIIVILIIIII